MRIALPLIAAIAFGVGALNICAQKQVREHKFEQYSVPVYRGPAAGPNFKSLKGSLFYKTRIREGFKNGVNFAGHYALVIFGCGTGCRGGYLIDIRSGRIFDFPLGGEENYELTLDYRPNSRLLKTSWEAVADKEPYTATCVHQEFLLTGNVFKLLSQSKTPGKECEN
jgi:hypothetical protein